MNYDLHGVQKKVWKMLQKQKNEINETIKIVNIDKERWIPHFENNANN